MDPNREPRSLKAGKRALPVMAGPPGSERNVFFSLYLRSHLRIKPDTVAAAWTAALFILVCTRSPRISGSWGLMGLGKGRSWRARVGSLAVLRVVMLSGVALVALAGCSAVDTLGTVDPRYGVSSSARVIAPGEPIPKGGGTYRIGQAYTVGGRTYVPAEDRNYQAEGLASWYGEDFHGRQTANGEIFDMNSVSAAHATLPMPTYVRVTNLDNHRSVVVRVNDRGPYHPDRIIDVSVKTAVLLGFYSTGVARVRVEYVGTAPLEGSDDNMLIATLRQGEPAPAPSLVRVASARSLAPRNVPVPMERPWGLGQGDAPNAPSGNDAPARPAFSAYLPASSSDPPPPTVRASSIRSFN
jgi:peptidoglycan lytic transglycosylase